jgi:hypothetical protein
VYIPWQVASYGVQFEQRQFQDGQDYDPRRVRLATVHARRDIVGLYYLMSWIVEMLAVLTGLIAAHSCTIGNVGETNHVEA